MKAIVYCRKSTDREDKQAQSLDRQKEYCLNYAKQYSFDVVEIIEESKTAKQPWRPGFAKMLELLNKWKAQYVICWELSRLSRNAIDQWSIIWMTQQWIIKEIHSTSWIVDWNNILVMNIHFWLSNQYIVELRKNVLSWMQKKFASGWALWQAPTWYRNNSNKQYEVDEKQADFVKQIFELKARKYSYPEISKILYKHWFKSKTWKPKASSTIEQIVRNEFYIWIIKFQWNKTDWIHETFIDKKLFDEANWLIKTDKITADFDRGEFIFCKMIKYQWKAMRAYKTKNNVYYREASWIKPSFNISQKTILEVIEKELPKYTLPEILIDEFREWLFMYFNEMNKWSKKETIQIRKKIDTLKEENRNLARKNVTGLLDDELFRELQNENILKIKELEEDLKDYDQVDVLIDNEVVELYKMFTQSPKLFENYNIIQKGMFLKTVLVELNFDIKKELRIQETKLFGLIKDLNLYLWQSH